MAKKAPTAGERRYKGMVAGLGCAVCRRLGFDVDGMQAVVHHQVRGRGGWGRTSDYRAIPLCAHHHQHSGEGVHDIGDDEFHAHYGFREADLVAETRQTLRKYLPAGEEA